MQTIAAIYVRLSKDDLNTDYSKSIANQISGLKTFCIENKFKVYDVFIDDGYSGSSMDRPGFISMISKMKLKKFNTIIVKDLSRLGRNFVQVSEYVENIFPDNDIRFISVNDGYDSLTYSDDESIVLRSFLNDYYLKECKRKARNAVEKRSKAKAMTTGGIYGYKYDKDKNIIIDDPAALIVQEIFERYCNREKQKDIAVSLETRKVPTPAYQCILNYGINRYAITEDNFYKWTVPMIEKITKNLEYTGTAVNRKKIVQNGKVIINDDCTYVENALPQIISKELYEQAITIRNERVRRPVNNLDMLRVKGMCICGCCNSKMIYINDRDVYECIHCKNVTKASVLHKVVLLDCKNILREFNANQTQFMKRTISKLMDDNKVIEYKALQRKKSEIDVTIGKVFEEKLEGKITPIQFKVRMDALRLENDEIEKELLQFENVKLDEMIIIERFKEFTKSLENAELDSDLELIRCMVRNVLVSKDSNHFKIIYKFEK